jgi:hypothetical protein
LGRATNISLNREGPTTEGTNFCSGRLEVLRIATGDDDVGTKLGQL